jgi:mono/diheme cytochrome c family protein
VRGNMPPFANKLSEKEVNSLVEFVRRLKGPQQQQ